MNGNEAMFQNVGQNQRPSAKVYTTRGDTHDLYVAQYQTIMIMSVTIIIFLLFVVGTWKS